MKVLIEAAGQITFHEVSYIRNETTYFTASGNFDSFIANANKFYERLTRINIITSETNDENIELCPPSDNLPTSQLTVISIVCFALAVLCLFSTIICLSCKLYEKPSYCFFISKKAKGLKRRHQTPTTLEDIKFYEPLKRLRPVVPYQTRQRITPLRYLSADTIH